jgi:hypothetical protein
MRGAARRDGGRVADPRVRALPVPPRAVPALPHPVPWEHCCHARCRAEVIVRSFYVVRAAGPQDGFIRRQSVDRDDTLRRQFERAARPSDERVCAWMDDIMTHAAARGARGLLEASVAELFPTTVCADAADLATQARAPAARGGACDRRAPVVQPSDNRRGNGGQVYNDLRIDLDAAFPIEWEVSAPPPAQSVLL